MHIVKNFFAVTGFILTVLFCLALYLDIRAMDRTKGGYQAPYTSVTGETLDWGSMDLTATGVVRRGYVLNFIVNATSGMISLQLLGIEFEARKLSPRAIVVHKPREAFMRMGFEPEF